MRRRTFATWALAVAALMGVGCDQEDARDVREGINDVREGAEEVGKQVEDRADQIDKDGKDD